MKEMQQITLFSTYEKFTKSRTAMYEANKKKMKRHKKEFRKDL